MSNEKLFSAKEAAQAVLAKASELAKGEWKKIHDKLEREGYSKESADKIDGAIKAKVEKSEDGMKAAPSTDKNAPGEKAQDTPEGVKASPNPAAPNDKVNGNPAPGAFPQNEEKYAAEGLKGHLKLAKFVGRMEEKRKAKTVVSAAAPAPAAAPLGKGEGVDRDAGAPLHRKVAYDKKGDQLNSKIAAEGAKDNHVKKLAEIKAAPKPKLPG